MPSALFVHRPQNPKNEKGPAAGRQAGSTHFPLFLIEKNSGGDHVTCSILPPSSPYYGLLRRHAISNLQAEASDNTTFRTDGTGSRFLNLCLFANGREKETQCCDWHCFAVIQRKTPWP